MNIIVAVDQVYYSLKIFMNYSIYLENRHNLGDEGHEYDLARNEVSF